MQYSVNAMGKTDRLISLDVMRGLTVAAMVLVNNGAGPDTYAPLKHSVWNGLTPCDLVFPFFLFMVGVSVFASLKKYSFTPSGPLVRKILKRTVLLFAVGLLLHQWDMMTKGNWHLFSELRVWGVLQRIALCYGAVSLLVLYVPLKRLTYLMFVLFGGYMLLLALGNGYEMSGQNILAVVDNALFGKAHLYAKSPIDPEGLLGTLPAIVHTYLGFICGKTLFSSMPLRRKMKVLLITALVLLVATLCFVFGGFPLNKRIWSPSYVTCTCGMAMAVLLLLLLIIDGYGKKRWCRIFQMFGQNAFFIYIVSEVLASALSHWGVKAALYELISGVIGDTYLSSLAYALGFVGVMGMVAWMLWKKNIFIKL